MPVTRLTVRPGYSFIISAVMFASTFCAMVDELPMRSVPAGVLLNAYSCSCTSLTSCSMRRQP
ncbi:hypothetical protein AN414_15070 [Serratia marcescens]|nr:hypothetical protein AN414_15070 [Serratia marcescens]